MALTQNQQFLHMALTRLNGLKVARHADAAYQPELERIQAAVTDIEQRMPDKERAEYYAQVNKVLSPKEQAELAKKIEAQMAENRDRPSH